MTKSPQTESTGRSERSAEPYAVDPQLRAARPIEEITQAIRRPGGSLVEILRTVMIGYAERPALGERARELVIDSATGA
jgi:fatty acid CoA ligase FadD9